ncbi:MAG: GTP-binding protein [Pseudomonadota bacterium]
MTLTRVPANLISGFLGAGKTTVILNLLAQRPPAERWAVLINDFGKIILNDAVRDSGGGIVAREVSGGCICCTAQVELRTALVRLLREARPQRLLIELSSAGRPSAILNVLREKSIAEALDLRASLCVLDPHQFADPALGARADYLEQMVFADILVINKNDTAGSVEMAKIREAAAKLPGRMAVVTAQGQISATLLDAPARSA